MGTTIGTIFVIIGILITVAVFLIVDWVGSRFEHWGDRTEELEERVDGHQAVLQKHEELHSEQEVINQQTIGKSSSG